MSTLIIRDMTIDDLPRVFEIGVKEFSVLDEIYHQYWSLTSLVDYLVKEKELCLVAELDGSVIGFVLGRKRFSEWQSDIGHLEWIAVVKEHQSKGFGSELCNTIQERFRKAGITKILADVRRNNLASERMFRRLGFQEQFSVIWFVKELKHNPPRVQNS